MAKVRQRTWRVQGQRTKRKAWGFVTVERGLHRNGCPGAPCAGCRQVRVFKTEWTQEDAQNALAAFVLKIEEPKPTAAPAAITLSLAVERYLATKARKRTVSEDKRQFEHLKAALGAETPLPSITASRISEYKAARLATPSVRRKDAQGKPTPLSAASINRPLALLRHLLRIAHEEWELLPTIPKVKLEKEPQGRIRWLEPDEEVRLLDACRPSRTEHLAGLVTVAIETGMRKSELLGLTWDRVDLSRGVIRLEVTKSGKRREIPMRQRVYDVLAAFPEPRQGCLWPAEGLRSGFEAAVEAAKLDNLHFHDLRHHFASWYIMRGGSLPALQQILGHADIKMTLRYAHLAPEHLRAEIVKTERPAQTASEITQEITHEAVREDASGVPAA